MRMSVAGRIWRNWEEERLGITRDNSFIITSHTVSVWLTVTLAVFRYIAVPLHRCLPPRRRQARLPPRRLPPRRRQARLHFAPRPPRRRMYRSIGRYRPIGRYRLPADLHHVPASPALGDGNRRHRVRRHQQPQFRFRYGLRRENPA